jgi:hypothetical protein
MGVLEEISAYLVSQGLGTLGTDLFLSTMGDTPDVVTVLVARPGMTGYRTHDIAGEALERPAVDVLVRGSSAGFAAAMTKAHVLWAALAQVTNMTLSGVRYQSIEPLTPPVDHGRDPHDRPVIGFRMLITKTPS